MFAKNYTRFSQRSRKVILSPVAWGAQGSTLSCRQRRERFSLTPSSARTKSPSMYGEVLSKLSLTVWMGLSRY